MHYTTIDSHKVKDSNPGPCTTPPLTPQKVYSNPRPCTTPPLTPKIRTTTMHYTTIDPQNVKYSNPRPCTTPPLTHKRHKFEPKTMRCTTIDDPRKDKHDKDSNPQPFFFLNIILFNMRKIHSYQDDNSKQHSAHSAAALYRKRAQV
jgi:hypothetical protein